MVEFDHHKALLWWRWSAMWGRWWPFHRTHGGGGGSGTRMGCLGQELSEYHRGLECLKGVKAGFHLFHKPNVLRILGRFYLHSLPFSFLIPSPFSSFNQAAPWMCLEKRYCRTRGQPWTTEAHLMNMNWILYKNIKEHYGILGFSYLFE